MVKPRAREAVLLVAIRCVPSKRLRNCAIGRIDFVRDGVAPAVVGPDFGGLSIGCQQHVQILVGADTSQSVQPLRHYRPRNDKLTAGRRQIVANSELLRGRSNLL
jgi:hypothetical protein